MLLTVANVVMVSSLRAGWTIKYKFTCYHLSVLVCESKDYLTVEPDTQWCSPLSRGAAALGSFRLLPPPATVSSQLLQAPPISSWVLLGPPSNPEEVHIPLIYSLWKDSHLCQHLELLLSWSAYILNHMLQCEHSLGLHKLWSMWCITVKQVKRS